MCGSEAQQPARDSDGGAERSASSAGLSSRFCAPLLSSAPVRPVLGLPANGSLFLCLRWNWLPNNSTPCRAVQAIVTTLHPSQVTRMGSQPTKSRKPP